MEIQYPTGVCSGGLFRAELLNPLVLERALIKLSDRLRTDSGDGRVSALEAEQARVGAEVARLTAAIAAGGSLTALVPAIRQREERLESLGREIRQPRAAAGAVDLPLDIVMPEVRRRCDDWQSVLVQEPAQARRMIRMLLRGRIVFTPDLKQRACEMTGEGDLWAVLKGLVAVPKALASPTGFEPVFWP